MATQAATYGCKAVGRVAEQADAGVQAMGL